MADPRLSKVRVNVRQSMQKEHALVNRLLRDWRPLIHAAQPFAVMREEAQVRYGDPEHWTLEVFCAAFPELPLRLFHEFDKPLSATDFIYLTSNPGKCRLIARMAKYRDYVGETKSKDRIGVIVDRGGTWYILHDALDYPTFPYYLDKETGEKRWKPTSQIWTVTEDGHVLVFEKLEDLTSILVSQS
jgi:hypothetical protein